MSLQKLAPTNIIYQKRANGCNMYFSNIAALVPAEN